MLAALTRSTPRISISKPLSPNISLGNLPCSSAATKIRLNSSVTPIDDPSNNYIVYVPMKVIYHDIKDDNSNEFSVETMFQAGKTAYFSIFNMAFNLNNNMVLPGYIADFGRNGKLITSSDLSSETVANSSTASSTAVVSQTNNTLGADGNTISKTNTAVGEGGEIKEYPPPIWQSVDGNDILSSWYSSVTEYVANNRAEVFKRSFTGANVVELSGTDHQPSPISSTTTFNQLLNHLLLSGLPIKPSS